MEKGLFRILYCSRNLVSETGGQQLDAINHILQTARSNNSRKEVTGALLYSSGYFAQVLEGPKASIEQVFESIQRDQRHKDVTVLECSGIHLRDFAEWSMARVQPVTDTQEAIASIALQTALEDPEAAGQGVLELLRSLVIQED